MILRRQVTALRSPNFRDHVCWINDIVMTRLLVRRLQDVHCRTNNFLRTINQIVGFYESRCNKYVGDFEDNCAITICRAAIGHIGPIKTASKMVHGEEDTSEMFDTLKIPLFIAILLNDITFLKRVVDEGVDVNMESAYFGTPLQLAVAEGHIELVAQLLENGADTMYRTRNGTTALRSSCRRGHQCVVHLLLDPKYRLETSGVDYENATKEAVIAGHTGLVQFLIERSDSTNLSNLIQEMFWTSAWEGHEEILQLMIDMGADVDAERIATRERALEVVAYTGHLSIVSLLLRQGANLNYNGNMSALHGAAKNGDEVMANLLLDHGANINYSGIHGPPLWEAANEQHLGMIRLLLDRGADLNSDECGDECLWQAVAHGREGVVRILAEAGVDVNKCGEDEPPPTLEAMLRGHTRITKFLLDFGAVPLDLCQGPWAERFRKGEYSRSHFRSLGHCLLNP